jgi:DNA-directed RNA polymerase specialized sigma24 family protein
MDAKHKTMLEMRDNGASLAELAEVFNSTPKSVSVTLSRIRKSVRA